MMHRRLTTLCLLCVSVSPWFNPLRADVVVSPTTLDLRHPRRPHALQVLATTADGYTLDLRPQARFELHTTQWGAHSTSSMPSKATSMPSRSADSSTATIRGSSPTWRTR